ncbi:MAG: MoaD/ThiS family protein [Phaeodactylibacter sp.]|nr:MoaD/ThiS family protein [Phaeodactylibacter sp.]MCB9304360.1 MoaD/ThiS family protein [Lewinellaceae bacterium]HQU59332.1 MoaD/ThiS family protein [Saprospiraceae bacterium]
MQVKIHAFGIARDILGGSSLSIEMPEQATVAQLKARLCQDFPSFEKLASLAVALNTEYASDSQIIGAGDEVVIIPPVSGG